ncbi:MAG: YlxR family protein [Caldilineales bacterium]|nr:YlxR family protein [Caldilineales bacterium]
MMTKARKHIPQRTCIICRRTAGKRELQRIVRTPTGVRYDPTGKLPGRGAYLCDSPLCWQAAIERGALARALKTSLSDEERAALRSLAAKIAEDG